MSNAVMLEDCEIVWLCPLEIELRAAIAMLDRIFEDIPPRARGQNVVYTIGEIGCHKVAVVGYHQELGLATSASMAAEVLRDLPNLEMGLLVGIASGIPSSSRDIQLGDVAVAVPEDDRPGVVGYDLGKAGENDAFELKHWQNATHPLLRSVINVIRARNEFGFRRHLESVKGRPEFQRPNSSPVGSDLSTNEQNLDTLAHPMVHYGTILSGNKIIKSKETRDKLRDKYGGIAVEMQAAGMMNRLPVAVIRGISDFADSSKNDSWQPYAAITAAAYAKEVLSYLPSNQGGNQQDSQKSSPFSTQDVRLAQALPERWAFVGREEELAYLEQELGYKDQPPLQKCIVGLWGLSGVGKSQLASRFVNHQRSKHSKLEIFWISGESQEAFEQSVIDMLKAPGNPVASENTLPVRSSHEQRIALVNSFFVELNRLADSRWLLVIDGVSGKQYMNPNNPISFDIHSFVGKLNRGSILLTARRRDMIERYHPIREVKGLKDEAVINLLKLQVDSQLLNDGGMEELARLLKGLPLALRLAVSIISRYRYSLSDYIEQWKNCSYNNGLLGTGEILFRSMEIGFDELEAASPIAAKILTLFSFLDHKDLWYDLCRNATNDTFPAWLRELAIRKEPFRNYSPALADLSFIELKSSVDGHQLWETHPAIQLMARQRAFAQDQEYIRCAISLVADQVPRSYEENFWEKMRRLEPHADQCWGYIRRGRWGTSTNLTELDSFGRLFRHVGRYEQAALIYRMIERGLNLHEPTVPVVEFLADVYTNLGLVYIAQRKTDLALAALEKSSDLRQKLGTFTPEASMSITYNKAVVFMMTGRLDEADAYLRSAAAHFARHKTNQDGLMKNERKRLYIRILNDIGEVLFRKGSVAEATDVFKHVLDSQREELGESHPTMVSIKLNLGRAYAKLGQFGTARNLLDEVIAIYAEWWGRRHPDTMRAIGELALGLMEEGEKKVAAGSFAGLELQRAEEIWNEALAFYKSTYGDESDMAEKIKSNLRHLSLVREDALGNRGHLSSENLHAGGLILSSTNTLFPLPV
ncbi:hypothetical protein EMCG_08615 [[Emmonsia] crescens]|uniref:Nucleoside phosphorylase domain-containing protein n=1 Tax=[Emmonsia] crescens TaxID=73230 RepID=A0A0G2I4K6_9EURO|nr:hypothetical protein EMCG_08615 [Emmonsia crescens UAMH 3008]